MPRGYESYQPLEKEARRFADSLKEAAEKERQTQGEVETAKAINGEGQ